MNVQGKNVILLIEVAGVLTPLACARSATFNITTDFIETSVSGSGLNASFLPTKNSFTMSAEGVVSLMEPGKLSIDGWQALQLAQTLLTVEYQRTDEAGNIFSNSCTAYISSSSDTGTYDDMDTFSIEMRGTGVITLTSTAAPPPPRLLRENGTDFILTETGGFILRE